MLAQRHSMPTWAFPDHDVDNFILQSPSETEGFTSLGALEDFVDLEGARKPEPKGPENARSENCNSGLEEMQDGENLSVATSSSQVVSSLANGDDNGSTTESVNSSENDRCDSWLKNDPDAAVDKDAAAASQEEEKGLAGQGKELDAAEPDLSLQPEPEGTNLNKDAEISSQKQTESINLESQGVSVSLGHEELHPGPGGPSNSYEKAQPLTDFDILMTPIDFPDPLIPASCEEIEELQINANVEQNVAKVVEDQKQKKEAELDEIFMELFGPDLEAQKRNQAAQEASQPAAVGQVPASSQVLKREAEDAAENQDKKSRISFRVVPASDAKNGVTQDRKNSVAVIYLESDSNGGQACSASTISAGSAQSFSNDTAQSGPYRHGSFQGAPQLVGMDQHSEEMRHVAVNPNSVQANSVPHQQAPQQHWQLQQQQQNHSQQRHLQQKQLLQEQLQQHHLLQRHPQHQQLLQKQHVLQQYVQQQQLLQNQQVQQQHVQQQHVQQQHVQQALPQKLLEHPQQQFPGDVDPFVQRFVGPLGPGQVQGGIQWVRPSSSQRNTTHQEQVKQTNFLHDNINVDKMTDRQMRQIRLRQYPDLIRQLISQELNARKQRMSALRREVSAAASSHQKKVLIQNFLQKHRESLTSVSTHNWQMEQLKRLEQVNPGLIPQHPNSLQNPNDPSPSQAAEAHNNQVEKSNLAPSNYNERFIQQNGQIYRLVARPLTQAHQAQGLNQVSLPQGSKVLQFNPQSGSYQLGRFDSPGPSVRTQPPRSTQLQNPAPKDRIKPEPVQIDSLINPLGQFRTQDWPADQVSAPQTADMPKNCITVQELVVQAPNQDVQLLESSPSSEMEVQDPVISGIQEAATSETGNEARSEPGNETGSPEASASNEATETNAVIASFCLQDFPELFEVVE